MASKAERIGGALAAGVLGAPPKAQATVKAAVIAPVDAKGNAVDLKKLGAFGGKQETGTDLDLNFVLSTLTGVDTATALSAVLRSLIPILTAPLILGQVSQITNEIPLLRPLRRKYAPQMLTALEIIDAVRRKQFKKDDGIVKMEELGLAREDIDALFKVSEFLPGAQDVIRFAVREVYSPEIRAKFKLDEGVKDVLTSAKADLEAAGVSEETLTKYWAAHWDLPSVGQGFEMFHRGIIDNEELDLLMRALDINPFWRDKLKQLSFSPLTRVDVRRMHKLGILDDKGVVKAYRDIGYSPENAEFMLKFTKASNADPTTDEETFTEKQERAEKDLTRSDILDAYKEGLLDKAKALQGLKHLHYSDKEAGLLLERVDLEDKLEHGKATFKSLKVGFLAGIFDKAKVTKEMSAIGYPAKEIDEWVKSWELEAAAKVELPTKADYLRWLGKGAIPKAEAQEGLKRLGIPDKFIALYIDEHLPESKPK